MSNSYTHFAVALPLTTEQGEEAQRLLTLYSEYVDDKYFGDKSFEIPAEDKAFIDAIETVDYEADVGLTLTIEDDAVFLADDAGQPNMELAGRLIKALLDKHDIDTPIGLEWGCTSDRQAPGGFGGGAAVITRDGIEWMNTMDWLVARIPGLDTEPEPAAGPTPDLRYLHIGAAHAVSLMRKEMAPTCGAIVPSPDRRAWPASIALVALPASRSSGARQSSSLCQEHARPRFGSLKDKRHLYRPGTRPENK